MQKDAVSQAIEQSHLPLQPEFVFLSENDTLAHVCERLLQSESSPDLLIDVSHSKEGGLAARAVGLPLVSAKAAGGVSDDVTRQDVVHFKSPDRLLIEAARDAIPHFGLDAHKVRVLFDGDYGER